MNLLDVALIGFIIWQIVRGVRSGLVRQTISLLSLLLAFVAASFISPLIISKLGPSISKPLATIIIFSIILLVISIVAELASKKLVEIVHRSQKIDEINQITGGMLGLAFAIVAIWLLAGVFSSTVWPNLSRQIKTSRVVRVVDSFMPPPPGFISQVQNYLRDLSFPKVFVGFEPDLNEPVNLPSEESVRAIAIKYQDSVVKIMGYGCGNYVSDGSGFVAAKDLIVTNAHVVAGIDKPIVQDKNGRHQSDIIHFDPDVDLAILRANSLAGTPIPIRYSDVPRGSQGVVLGYPGGGGYSAVSAGVIEKIIAVGRNIYGTGQVQRPVYGLNTSVVPGNSGGPFVLTSGEVAGVIFASSQTNENVGYSLTSEMLKPALNSALNSADVVSSGKCLTR